MTSRKKIANLKKAAHRYTDYVLIRSGGCPGLMYAEGEEEGVKEWVACVHRLRYKDYHLLCRPALLQSDAAGMPEGADGGFHEVETVPLFAAELQKRGVLQWWRKAMGYVE